MDNTKLAERLRQFAESQRMDFYNPSTAAMLEDAAEALESAGTELTEERRANVNLQAGLTRAHKVRDKLRAERNALADALEAAEAERDSAWADGYNKAISQRLAASGSIEGNF